MKNLKLLLLALFVLLSGYSFSGIYYSSGGGTGDWEDSTSWSPNGIPGCDDTIIIESGHTIEITTQIDLSGCPNPIYILVRGTLSFPGNGPKLRLPCNSAVFIANGGLITANGSSGSSNNISICSSTVWSAADGDIDAPTVDTLGVIPPDVTTLGISLVEFKVSYVNGNNVLDWVVGSENNNDYYEIERTNDGIAYTSVGKVNGAGTYSGTLSYSLKDSDFKPNAINYYRLKWVDFDGEVAYSDLISIKNSGLEKPTLVGTYNLFGQSVQPNYTGVVIELYSDGSKIKKYLNP